MSGSKNAYFFSTNANPRRLIAQSLGSSSRLGKMEDGRQHSMFGATQPCESVPGTQRYSTTFAIAFEFELTGPNVVRCRKQHRS